MLPAQSTLSAGNNAKSDGARSGEYRGVWKHPTWIFSKAPLQLLHHVNACYRGRGWRLAAINKAVCSWWLYVNLLMFHSKRERWYSFLHHIFFVNYTLLVPKCGAHNLPCRKNRPEFYQSCFLQLFPHHCRSLWSGCKMMYTQVSSHMTMRFNISSPFSAYRVKKVNTATIQFFCVCQGASEAPSECTLYKMVGRR